MARGRPSSRRQSSITAGAFLVVILNSDLAACARSANRCIPSVVSMFRSGMPDLKVDILDMIAEGDKVATRYTVEGTHEGDLFGLPPTGRRVSIESFTVER